MATYSELRALFSNGDLRNRVEVACIMAAETINAEATSVDNHANRLLWAKATWSNPRAISPRMLMALLAANKDVVVESITGATDAQIQTKVDAAIDVFADGS